MLKGHKGSQFCEENCRTTEASQMIWGIGGKYSELAVLKLECITNSCYRRLFSSHRLKKNQTKKTNSISFSNFYIEKYFASKVQRTYVHSAYSTLQGILCLSIFFRTWRLLEYGNSLKNSNLNYFLRANLGELTRSFDKEKYQQGGNIHAWDKLNNDWLVRKRPVFHTCLWPNSSRGKLPWFYSMFILKQPFPSITRGNLLQCFLHFLSLYHNED